jgi:antitoxin component YwqK of YwqJK toxin-antitoxin module
MIHTLPLLIYSRGNFFACLIVVVPDMLRIQHCAFLLLLFCSACSRHVEIKTDAATGFRTVFTIDPDSRSYHGPYTRTDSTGRLLEKGTLVNGKLHGIREIYYPNGGIEIRERYDADVITGLYESFHPNGQLEQSGYLVNGAMTGLWRKWDDNGALLEEVLMKDNEENGPFVEYHPDGSLKAEGSYLHAKEDGTLKLYDEAGELQRRMLCYNGICYTKWLRE